MDAGRSSGLLRAASTLSESLNKPDMGLPVMTSTSLQSIETLSQLIADTLEDMKAVNVTRLDIKDISSVADLLFVASGNSTRHVNAIADDILEKVKAAGFRPLGSEGTETAEWVLIDMGDVIVHIMLPDTREFYDLERLWSARPIAQQSTSESELQ